MTVGRPWRGASTPLFDPQQVLGPTGQLPGLTVCWAVCWKAPLFVNPWAQQGLNLRPLPCEGSPNPPGMPSWKDQQRSDLLARYRRSGLTQDAFCDALRADGIDLLAAVNREPADLR